MELCIMHKLSHHVSAILPVYLGLLRDTVFLDMVLCMSYNSQPSELAYVAPSQHNETSS